MNPWRVADIVDAIAWRVMRDCGKVLLAPTRESADALAATLNAMENYRERMEDALGEKIYAVEKLLDHFDEAGNLKGPGKWRLREIYDACKAFDEGCEKAAQLRRASESLEVPESEKVDVVCPDCGKVRVVPDIWEGGRAVGGDCPSCHEYLHFA